MVMMTRKQLEDALGALSRKGLIEEVRGPDGMVRYSSVDMVNHHGEIKTPPTFVIDS